MRDNSYLNIMEFWTRKKIPYIFDETLSLYQLVRLTVKYLNEVINDQNELKDAIKEFIEMFDEDLEETVINVLQGWKDDGSLKEIINEALFESKLDKEVFEDFKLEIMNKQPLNPDDFDGNDLEKIQQCVDYARTNNTTETAIIFTRQLDITGLGSIIMTNALPSIYLVGLGGGITKRDSGFIFTTLEENRNRYHDINSSHMTYRSVAGAGTTVWDCRMVGIQTITDNYLQVDRVTGADTDYIQSFRMAFCDVQGGKGYALEWCQSYDVSIVNNRIENRDSAIRQHTPYHNLGFQSEMNNNLRIIDNVIEAIHSTEPVIHLGVMFGGEISGNYFEETNGICIDLSADMNAREHKTVTVSNNVVRQTDTQIADSTPGIKWGRIGSSDVTSFGNLSTGTLHDAATNSLGQIISIGDQSRSNELITPGKENRLFDAGSINKRWVDWVPTLNWTGGGGSPAVSDIKARYKVIGSTCFCNFEIRGENLDGATRLRLSRPVFPYNNGLTQTGSGFLTIDSKKTPQIVYYSHGFGNIIFELVNTGTSDFVLNGSVNFEI